MGDMVVMIVVFSRHRKASFNWFEISIRISKGISPKLEFDFDYSRGCQEHVTNR
jgi:molybdopterin synthase catalytic subunit